MTETRPDVIVLMTDEERAAPPYESDVVAAWRRSAMPGAAWFEDNAVSFRRHYTGSLACVPSRPTIFTGQYPQLHGVTQTDGLGKAHDDSRMRWLREGEVPTLGHWFRAAGYDTHYDGKWHISHADLHDADGNRIDTNDDEGNVLADGVAAYRKAGCLDPFGFSGWIIADEAPDLRGVWQAHKGPMKGHIERVEQAGDRVVITAGGVVHDMFADGTLSGGVNDIGEGGARVSVAARFEDGRLNLYPGDRGVVVVTRYLDGDDMVWRWGPYKNRLSRLAGPTKEPNS